MEIIGNTVLYLNFVDKVSENNPTILEMGLLAFLRKKGFFSRILLFFKQLYQSLSSPIFH
jgi:hypothetical protein